MKIASNARTHVSFLRYLKMLVLAMQFSKVEGRAIRVRQIACTSEIRNMSSMRGVQRFGPAAVAAVRKGASTRDAPSQQSSESDGLMVARWCLSAGYYRSNNRKSEGSNLHPSSE